MATRRSVVRLSAEREERPTGHWARGVQAACEQSGRRRVPRLLPVATMDEWLSGVVPGLKLLLIRREGACRLSELAPDPSITLLIGPEGGLAEEEASAALRAGYRALRLGPRVLRTETAAVAALSACRRCGAVSVRRLADLRAVHPVLGEHGPHRRGLLPETQRRFR